MHGRLGLPYLTKLNDSKNSLKLIRALKCKSVMHSSGSSVGSKIQLLVL